MTNTIQKGIPAFIPYMLLVFFDAQYFQIDVMNVTVVVKKKFPFTLKWGALNKNRLS
jgi:hypothetical protein